MKSWGREEVLVAQMKSWGAGGGAGCTYEKRGDRSTSLVAWMKIWWGTKVVVEGEDSCLS